MNKIRVSAVSYLNTKPFLYGIEQSNWTTPIDLQIDVPSECAKKLLNNEVEVGLVPVAILPQMANYEILSNFCIGCDGAVDSVMLFSDCPLNRIETIVLDYQSRTSVLLTRVLTQNHWKIEVEFSNGFPGYFDEIKGTTAGVVIGDRSFPLKNRFKYSFDLGLAWKEYTGLPFVFACWATQKKLPKEFYIEFNKALKLGIQNTKLVAQNLQSEFPLVNINDYFQRYIHFDFDSMKKQGLARFWKEIETLEPVLF